VGFIGIARRLKGCEFHNQQTAAESHVKFKIAIHHAAGSKSACHDWCGELKSLFSYFPLKVPSALMFPFLLISLFTDRMALKITFKDETRFCVN
jgi:hypothetical protein